VANDISLARPAAAALNSTAAVSTADVHLPIEPITGKNSDTQFVGRVIVEFWADQPVVGVFGSDPGLMLEHATTALNNTPAA
jgi:hypothetical protein